MSDNIQKNINTEGGSSVHGDVNSGRDFIGRDQTIGTQINIYNPLSSTQPKISYSELVVDTMNRGDFLTISEAISAARPGDKILVYPGIYEENLVIDKSLELEGIGRSGDVIVQITGMPVLRSKALGGQIRNFTLRALFTFPDNPHPTTFSSINLSWPCVKIEQGSLLIENCNIILSSE